MLKLLHALFFALHLSRTLKQKNIMKTLSNILTTTFLTALFIYTLIVLTAGLLLTIGYNLPLNDVLLSISGTLFIVSFSYIYTNLNN